VKDETKLTFKRLIYTQAITKKEWTMRKIILIAIALVYLAGCGISYM
jgi:hypothetical protein